MDTWEPQYLHVVGPNVSWLDHKITPEVRAMFCAMMSRVPKGSIRQRYEEVVAKVARNMYVAAMNWSGRDGEGDTCPLPVEAMRRAEERLTTYPLHPIVQEFFDEIVAKYGHSSVLELTGNPSVFIEHISMWFAYLSFDNPLVAGQETSTRAVWRRDWPMASDCLGQPGLNNALLQGYHELGLAITAAEIEAWKVELQKSCEECQGDGKFGAGCKNTVMRLGSATSYGAPAQECANCAGTGKKYPWMKDPQPFRPAFDRARWALPGTIETGVSHTANLRTMARVIKAIEDYATASGNSSAMRVMRQVKDAYRQAMPGLADMGLREAVYAEEATVGDVKKHHAEAIPGHLWVHEPLNRYATAIDGPEAAVALELGEDDTAVAVASPYYRKTRKGYADPFFNYVRMDVSFRCSWAAARDWHRHRSFYPWTLLAYRCCLKANVHNLEDEVWSNLRLHEAYAPISEYGKAHAERYFALATQLYDGYIAEGNEWMARASMPLGTKVYMGASGGLRDGMYMLSIRSRASGANFEYKAQAEMALQNMLETVPPGAVRKELELEGEE